MGCNTWKALNIEEEEEEEEEKEEIYFQYMLSSSPSWRPLSSDRRITTKMFAAVRCCKLSEC